MEKANSKESPLNNKRIALLLPKLSRYGGVEQFAWRLADALAKRGARPSYICARKEVDPPAGVDVICLGRFGIFRFIKSAYYFFRSERVLQEQKFDYVISLGKNISQDLVRMGGGPLKTFWQKSEESYSSPIERICKRVSRLLSPVNYLILWIEKKQFVEHTQVIAVSHLVKKWLLEAYPRLQERNIQVVYNRPDLSVFTPPSAEERVHFRSALFSSYVDPAKYIDSKYIDSKSVDIKTIRSIGVVTTNFQLKGVRYLIQALALLPEFCHLFVVGGRQSKRYEQLAKRLGVEARVHFCGKLTDMPSYYKGIDVFVLPSFYDACSNAVLEALASGCRTISSVSNGSAYFLQEQDRLIDPKDVANMAKIIERELDAPIQRFDWPKDVVSGIDSFVDAVEHLYIAQGEYQEAKDRERGALSTKN